MTTTATAPICTITPVRNGAPFIAAAVDSLLAAAEVRRAIVVDDASTDNTLDVLNDLQTRYGDRLRVAQLPRHLNQFAAMNLGLAIVNALDPDVPWIGFLDADDRVVSTRFAKQLDLAREDSTATHPVVAVGGLCHNTAPDGTPYPADDPRAVTQNIEFDPLDIALKAVANLQWTATSIYRREVFAALGGFAYSLTHGDSDFFVRLAFAAQLRGWRLRNVTSPVVLRRVALDQQVSLTHAHSRSLQRHAADRLLAEQHAYYRYLMSQKLLEPEMLYLGHPFGVDAARQALLPIATAEWPTISANPTATVTASPSA